MAYKLKNILNKESLNITLGFFGVGLGGGALYSSQISNRMAIDKNIYDVSRNKIEDMVASKKISPEDGVKKKIELSDNYLIEIQKLTL